MIDNLTSIKKFDSRMGCTMLDRGAGRAWEATESYLDRHGRSSEALKVVHGIWERAAVDADYLASLWGSD